MKDPIILKRGIAIVLVGEQGCGKTLLATELAEAHGTSAWIDGDRLHSHFGLGSLLAQQPTTLIVEGFPASAEGQGVLKNLIANPTIVVERKGKNPTEVPTPHVIICTHAHEFVLPPHSRRFNVIRVLSPGHNRMEGAVQ